MAGDIVIGTCGYDYPEWKGVFYPPSTPRKDFLPYYATQFGALEIDSTFYRMPSATWVATLYERSEGHLLFSLKAFRSLTHEITQNWRNDAAQLKESMKPLADHGVLSAVLFQFPQSFHYTRDNRFYLSYLLEVFQGFPCVVEFRHRDWSRDSVYEGLDKRNAGICVADMPHLSSLPALDARATGGIGYVRFHGRNSSSWYASGPEKEHRTARYAYDYTEQELTDASRVVRAIAQKAKITHVFFNNHPGGKAAVNAQMMKKILDAI